MTTALAKSDLPELLHIGEAITGTCRGIMIQSLPFEQYRKIPAYNKSFLCAMAETPADGKDFLDSGGETTAALDFGIGAHALILEPEKFAENFAIGPDVKLNTNVGKAEWENFTAQHPGKTLIRGKDGVTMLAMRKRLFEHPLASDLLAREGEVEVTLVWRDDQTGLLCKGRLDLLPGRDVVDYKTTRNATRFGFGKTYGDCRYFVQEAMYSDGFEAVFGHQPQHFYFIAQEKTGTHKVNVFDNIGRTLDRSGERLIERGRRMYRDLLTLAADCEQRGEWPAYDNREYMQGAIADAIVPEFSMRGAE